MRRLLLTLSLVLLGTAGASAQGVPFELDPPAPNAELRICTYPDNGFPCINFASVFFDAGETLPVSQPIQLGPTGRIILYMSGGTYVGQFSSPPFRRFLIPAGGPNASPQGSDNTLQKKNGTNFAASGISDDGTNVTVDRDFHPKGPNPYVDVTRYGVRVVNANIAPAIPGITASISSGSATATLSAASTFQNGDGVVIYGAGAAHSLTTPNAPTVTPSIAQVGTGTGVVANGLTGATTYDYQIIARNKAGGLTAASATGTTTTGAASLGSQSVSITSASRSNDVVTVVTASVHGLAVGAMVYITQISDGSFGGWYRVDTVADNTHFTFSSGMDTRTGASTSATGGTAFWFNCNHLTWTAVTGAWEYYIYGRATGSFALIGVSRPQGAVVTDLVWDDFGSTMMGGILLPPFVPSTPPASATSNHLVTTIASGAGTTTLTLAAVASTTVSGATILFDNAPNIATAAGTAANGNGTLYFPVGTSYVVNSYLTLPAFLAVSQAGGLYLNETAEIAQGTQWYGWVAPQGNSVPSFSWQGGAPITVNRANPGFYISGRSGNAFYALNIGGTANGALLMVGDRLNGATWDHVNFTTSSSSTDYMGIALMPRGITSDSSFSLQLKDCLFSGGPTQVNGTSATPLFFCQFCGQTMMERLQINRRGLLYMPAQAGGDLRIIEGRAQGGIIPTLIVTGGVSGNVGGVFEISGYGLDTTAHPLVAHLPQASGSTSFSLYVNGGQPFPAFDGVGAPGMVGGRKFTYIAANNVSFSGQNRDVHLASSGTALDGVFATALGTSSAYSLQRANAAIVASPSYQFFTDQVPLAAPTCPVSAGGSVPVATTTYQVVPVWQNGAEGTPSFPCTATTTAGNQTVTLTWTAAPGNPKGYNIRRGNQTWAFPGGTCPAPPQVASPTVTAAITGGASCGTAPTLPAGGPSVVNSAGLMGPQLLLNGITFANLGTPQNGIITYCSDCTIANPCAGGGTGAIAKRLNGVWVCN